MERNENIEIPQVDIPDEVTHTNQPEVEITTPHPVVPQPEAGVLPAEPSRKIGFQPHQ